MSSLYLGYKKCRAKCIVKLPMFFCCWLFLIASHLDFDVHEERDFDVKSISLHNCCVTTV